MTGRAGSRARLCCDRCQRRDRRRDGRALPARGREGCRCRPARRGSRRPRAPGRCHRARTTSPPPYAACATEFGRIDVLFNNAGISPNDDASVIDTTLEAWERVQNVNLRSVFLCCKHGIPHLLENEAAARIGDQHRLVRRGHGRRDLPDLLHGLEGRCALALARDRRRVRPPGCARERAVPRARSTRRC